MHDGMSLAAHDDEVGPLLRGSLLQLGRRIAGTNLERPWDVERVQRLGGPLRASSSIAPSVSSGSLVTATGAGDHAIGATWRTCTAVSSARRSAVSRPATRAAWMLPSEPSTPRTIRCIAAPVLRPANRQADGDRLTSWHQPRPRLNLCCPN